MTSGLVISAFMPSITSSGIFSSRRMGKGADAMSANNPFVGLMNFDIAGGQILNAAKGTANIAREAKNSVASGILSAEESIKNLAKTDKVVNSVGKVLNFTADHINPIICATSAVKVLGSDNKKETAFEEGLALGTMFLSEHIAKKAFGMPKLKNLDNNLKVCEEGLYSFKNGKKELIAENGKFKVLNNNKVAIERNGFFFKKQAEALEQYCATKKLFNKSIKFLPGMLKGIAFITASICGYNLGLSAADKILAMREK